MGLGAPVGAVLVGSRDFIAKALRARKLVGGGMRQAGILAAAGIYALENHVEDLVKDHERARVLTSELSSIAQLKINPDETQTNMVFLRPSPEDIGPLRRHLAEQGIILSGGEVIRAVLHRDIDDQGLARTIDAISGYYT